MLELPTGKVTFLFTDIEGSTQLWEQAPDRMGDALARHDALLREAVEGCGGYVFKTVGDAFYAVFAAPPDAVTAAVSAQRALLQELPQLRVRMAIHTGAAEVRDGDYFGPALNRVARLLAAAHGGQVLVSRSTADISCCPDGAHLRSLGIHRLRDLAKPEAIFQLQAPDLPDDFPPPNTLDVAFRRGLARAAAISGVVIAALATLSLVAVTQARRAEAGRQALRRHLYVAQVNLAQQAWEAGNLERAKALLIAQEPRPGQEELRGWEWRYLRRLCQDDALFTFRGHTGPVQMVAFSSDGRTVLSSSKDGTIRLWDVPRRHLIGTLGMGREARSGAFSPDGKIAALPCGDRGDGLWQRRSPLTEGSSLWGMRPAPSSFWTSPDVRAWLPLGDIGTSSCPLPSLPTGRSSPRAAQTAPSSSGTSPRNRRSSPFADMERRLGP